MTQQKKNQPVKSRIPIFKNRQELAKFWDTHEVSDYLDELEPVELTFNPAQPKQETIVVRLHTGIKNTLEKIAQQKGLTISSLARMWLMEKLQTARS